MFAIQDWASLGTSINDDAGIYHLFANYIDDFNNSASGIFQAHMWRGYVSLSDH